TRDSEKLSELHPADSGEAWLPAARFRNGTIPAGVKDSEFGRRRSGESGYSGPRAAVYEGARREGSTYGTPRGLGSGRGGVHRKSRSARIFQSEHLGGQAHVFAFNERREMLDGLAAKARSGKCCEAARTEKENSEDDHNSDQTVCRTRARATDG